MTTVLTERQPTSEEGQAESDHIGITTMQLLHTATTASFESKTDSLRQLWIKQETINIDCNKSRPTIRTNHTKLITHWTSKRQQNWKMKSKAIDRIRVKANLEQKIYQRYNSYWIEVHKQRCDLHHDWMWASSRVKKVWITSKIMALIEIDWVIQKA